MSDERPKKDTDSLSKEKIALYRTIKWAYYMGRSCVRAYNETRLRNLVRPEFASIEVLGLFEGQAKAYENMVKQLIKNQDLPTLKDILKMPV